MLSISTILHPTDFSERSEFAFRLACALARDHGAKLIVMHAWTWPTFAYGEALPAMDAETFYSHDAERALRRIQPPDLSVQMESLLVEGEAASAILRVAEERQVDLIVMGNHGHRGLRRLLMGSVAEQVVRRAACPVVTVKSPFHEPAEAMVGVTSEERGQLVQEAMNA